MKALFDAEAKKNNVYPLDDRGTGRIYIPKPSPGGPDPKRTRFTYHAGAVRLAEGAAPNTKNKSHTITADIVMPEKGGEGVIVAEGGSSAGLRSTSKTANSSITSTGSMRTVTSSPPTNPYPPASPRCDSSSRMTAVRARVVRVRSLSTGNRSEKAASRKPSRAASALTPSASALTHGSPVSNRCKPPFAFSGQSNSLRSNFDE